jgi:hypothetical protein
MREKTNLSFVICSGSRRIINPSFRRGYHPGLTVFMGLTRGIYYNR